MTDDRDGAPAPDPTAPPRYRTPRLDPDRGNVCAGCHHTGRCRFGLRVRSSEPGKVTGTAYFTADHEGAGGVVRGGSTTGALDEASGLVVVAGGGFGVTAEIDVRFRWPVPIERPLELTAWSESRDDRGHWIILAELHLPGRRQALCRTRGRFVEMDPTAHFDRFNAWLGTAGPSLS